VEVVDPSRNLGSHTQQEESGHFHDFGSAETYYAAHGGRPHLSAGATEP
jgi:hypothetical protein